MNELFNKICELMSGEYGIIITIICILFLLWGIYNKIKFLCLKKASEMVAKVEEKEELSGEEKFALCILWINEELPKLFRNSLFKSIISKLVNIIYVNSFDYMKNYIKRKTGYDITELIEQVKSTIEEDEKDKKLNETE